MHERETEIEILSWTRRFQIENNHKRFQPSPEIVIWMLGASSAADIILDCGAYVACALLQDTCRTSQAQFALIAFMDAGAVSVQLLRAGSKCGGYGRPSLDDKGLVA